jgi:hypothetical protein
MRLVGIALVSFVQMSGCTAPAAHPPVAPAAVTKEPTKSVLIPTQPIQFASEKPPSPRDATQVASVADFLESWLPAGTLVEVSGYVQWADSCENEAWPNETCRGRSFLIADRQFDDPKRSLRVIWTTNNSGGEPLAPAGRQFVQVRGTVKKEPAIDLAIFRGDPMLEHLSHKVTAPPPNPTLEPTYPDGSWSIHDLYHRNVLKPDILVAVTAYAYEVDKPMDDHCKSPKRGVLIRCSAIRSPQITATDQLEPSVDTLAIGFAEKNGKRMPMPKPKGRYIFHGRLFDNRISVVLLADSYEPAPFPKPSPARSR